MAISDSGKLIAWGSTDDLGQSYVTSGKHGALDTEGMDMEIDLYFIEHRQYNVCGFIQHVLERGKPHERSQIISKLSGRIVQLSQHKFASNVIKKCLEYGGPIEQELLIGKFLGIIKELIIYCGGRRLEWLPKKNDNNEKKLPRNVPKVSSAFFFNYNTSSGLPYRVLVDTNFINFSI